VKFPPQVAITFKEVTTTRDTGLSKVEVQSTSAQEEGSFTLMANGVYEIQVFI